MEVVSAGVDASKVHVLPPPVIAPQMNHTRGRFRRLLGISDQSALILFVGRISRIKNLVSLVEAFSLLPSEGAHLALVGPHEDAEYAEELRRAVCTHSIDRRFHMPGAIFGAGKDEAIIDATVCVLPSLSENFGHFAWEASGAGKVVVIGDNCGAGRYLEKSRSVITRVDAESLRIALLIALEIGRTLTVSPRNCTTVNCPGEVFIQSLIDRRVESRRRSVRK